jgi:hypothetical protein
MFPKFRTRLSAHKKTGNALMPKSVRVTCLLTLSAMCSAIFAKTALAQGYTAAVYAGTDDAQQNGLVAYGRKADGTLAYIGEYLSGGAGGRLNTGGPIDPLISAHSVLNVDNRFVLQVNAGSNTVSSFGVNNWTVPSSA